MTSPTTTAPRFHIVVGTAIYLEALAIVAFMVPAEVFNPETAKFILVIGVIGIWRYSWAAVHYVRAAIYRHQRFPELRRTADALAHASLAPHVYFMVTSYRVDAEVTANVYRAAIEEALRYGAPATIVAAVTDAADESLLEALFARLAPPDQVSLVLMRQAGTGKRDAMAAALRAISRRAPPPGSVVVLMDGDTVIPAHALRRCVPFFHLMPDLGALSTDTRASVEGSNWAKEWYDLRFAQRHLLMCSLSLSRRLLVLTGRMSIFRADIATDPSFIDQIENDVLRHWRFGALKFLTGDDKSTWFWLLRRRWAMLYVPDVQIRTCENLEGMGFASISTQLMRRWFGNMLRNNGRAIALGPRAMPPFIWWCLVDQRVSIWTTLTGPTYAALVSVFFQPGFFLVYVLWVMITRLIQALILIWVRGRFSPYFPLLLYYTQIVGSMIKIYTTFRLDRQNWTRQGIRAVRAGGGVRLWMRDLTTVYINALAVGVFLLAMAIATGVLPLPAETFFTRTLAQASPVPPLAGPPDLRAFQPRAVTTQLPHPEAV